MGSLLVHVTHGPEAGTRAALAFLVARAAVDAGHDVTVFVAGDGVQLLRSATADAVQGVGTGSLREHLDALGAAGVAVFASGMSSNARGVTAEGSPVPIELAPPAKLVELVFAADRVLTY